MDIAKQLAQQPQVHRTFRAAFDTHPAARKLAAIVRAYDQALLDPQTKMPTTLHLAIESARA